MPNKNQRNQQNILPSPYNFVPLSKQIFFPDWADKVSHDVPFKDGLSGSFDLYIKAKTPIFTRDDDPTRGPNEIQQFLNHKGKPFIKGSSIRGMIREVIKIAAFGKMDTADDRKFSMRDLSHAAEDKYRDKMKDAKAGWLTPDNQIIPCEYAKVSHNDLDKLHKSHTNNRQVRFINSNTEGKYKQWRLSLDIDFDTAPGRYGNLRAIELQAGTRGTLVFTGQVPNKKNEFVFFDKDPTKALQVSNKVFSEFDQVHCVSQQTAHTGDASAEPNEIWAFRKQQLANGQNIPVFYISEGDEVAALGLARLFRLHGELSVHDAIANVSKDHLLHENAAPDLADLIFGYVREDSSALKGRVSITHAELHGTKAECRSVTAPLQAPKASFYPTYLRQNPDIRHAKALKTWLDADAEIAGWKRYPARGSADPNPPRAQDQRMNTTFIPLNVGSSFYAQVYFHNLRPIELGALLWAIDFGGYIDGLVHRLGLAKPYGYGEVELKIDALELIPNDPAAEPPTRDMLREAFEDALDQLSLETPWIESEQITALLAMANPIHGERNQAHLRYPVGFGREGEYRKSKNGSSPLMLPRPWGLEETKTAIRDAIQAKSRANAAQNYQIREKKFQALPLHDKAHALLEELSSEDDAFSLARVFFDLRAPNKATPELAQLEHQLSAYGFQWLQTCFEDDEAHQALKSALHARYYSNWRRGRTASGEDIGRNPNNIKKYADYLKLTGDQAEVEPAETAPPADSTPKENPYAHLSEEEAEHLLAIGDDMGTLKERYNNSKNQQDIWTVEGLQALRQKLKELPKKIKNRKSRKKEEKWAKKALKEIDQRIQTLS